MWLSVVFDKARGSGGGINYNDQKSWKGKCSTGQEQSPIDIVTAKAKATTFSKISISEASDSAMGNIKVSNIGTSVTIQNDNFANIIVSGGGLDGLYKLVQFHFHWGLNDASGSEHLVDGKSFPLEMHAVFMKKKFAALTDALHSDSRDALAVLGVFFNAVSTGSSTLDPLDKVMTLSKDEEKTTTLDMKFRDLLPKNLDKFYRYSGSLTTPDCDEKVRWTLFQTPLNVTRSFLAKIRNIKGVPTFNFRQAQGLNDREILVSSSNRVQAIQSAEMGDNGAITKNAFSMWIPVFLLLRISF